jgi:hypothetical protein
MRKHGLGVWVIALGLMSGGGVYATPPGVAEIEGREVDPMVQVFHLSEVIRGSYVAPLAVKQPASDALGSGWDEPWERFLWQMSMPLGPAWVDDSDWFYRL